MPYRLAPLFVTLLSVSLLTVQAARSATEAYILKPYGSTASDAQPARHAVASIDYIWFDAQRGRSVPARVYYPADSDERFPVIVLSSGLGRSRDDCAYLGRHWASCGYVSVHVQHKGSDEDTRQEALRPRKGLHRAFYNPDNIRNRPIDVIFAIDQLVHMQETDSAIGDRLDLTRIGVAGHDFGAQSALALAGQVLPGRLAFAEPRVKAVLAMSTPVPLGQLPLETAFGNISRPCLHITGTADNSIVGTTTAQQRRIPFDYASGADQYLVTFYGADHLIYGGRARGANGAYDAMFQRLIAECSAVFWDAYLKDDPGAKTWLTGELLVNHVGAAGRVEQKMMEPKMNPVQAGASIVLPVHDSAETGRSATAVPSTKLAP